MMLVNEGRIQELIRTNECIYKHGDSFVFYSIFFCAIFIWNEKEKKCEKIIFLDKEFSSWLYVSCIKVENCLYFIPYKAKFMLRYYLGTERIERVSIRKKDAETLYHKGIHYCGKLYIFPDVGNELLIYNLKSQETEYDKFGVVNKFEKEIFFQNVYYYGGRVWTITGKDTNLYCYNLQENCCSIYKLEHNAHAIIDITGDRGHLFLLSVNGTVIDWDCGTKEETVILEGNNEKVRPYLKVHYCANRIVLVPKNDDYIRIISLSGQPICKWDFSDLRQSNGRLFEASVMQDGIIITCTFKGNIVIIDVNECKFRILDIKFELAQNYSILVHGGKNVIENKRKAGTYIWEQIQLD